MTDCFNSWSLHTFTVILLSYLGDILFYLQNHYGHFYKSFPIGITELIMNYWHYFCKLRILSV